MTSRGPTGSAPGEWDLFLPRPFPWQRLVLDSDARFKVLRKGRRSGGTRTALIAAISGHGSQRQFKGMVEGGRILWVAPDYKQASAIWREEFRPRFRVLGGVRINDADFIIEVPGAGSLEVISANNVDSALGRGPDGIVLDEAAHFDLEYAWTKVCRPALATKQGWAIFPSTTNADVPDGNAGHRTPSYFNMIAASITGAELPEGLDRPYVDEEWEDFNYWINDNPRLPQKEIASQYAALGGPDDPRAQQQLRALLVTGGAGLAFPEYRESFTDDQGRPQFVHLVPDRLPPRSWFWYGTLDWGYKQGAYQLHAVSSEGDVETVWEFYDGFTNLHAREAATTIFEASEIWPTPDVIYYDDQMDQDTGVRGGLTLIEEWYAGMNDAQMHGSLTQRPVMEQAVKGPGSRRLKKNMVHAYLKYDAKTVDPETGALQPWARPRWRIQKKCKALRRQLAGLSVSSRDMEDVDTTQPDHAYDSACNLLLSRMRMPEKPDPKWSQNVHPGIDATGRRQRRALTLMEEAEERGPYGSSPAMGYRAPRYGRLAPPIDDMPLDDDDSNEGPIVW